MTGPARTARPKHEVVASRLFTLGNRAQHERLSERELTYLDAVLTHWYATVDGWRTEKSDG